MSKSVSEYIKQLQSYEEYAFSWDELRKNCNAPEPTIRKELARLAERKELINLRKGFYLIIPPRYESLGKLPIQLYIDKLFKFLNKEYYVAMYSAAAFHGASHQQVQQDYIMTVPPDLRDINKGSISLHFFKTTRLAEGNIIEKKSEAGYFKISSPALTIADLIHHQSKIGGLNRILANIEELAEETTIDDLSKLLKWYPNKSTLQRMGYILEELKTKESLQNIIHKHLQKKTYYSILLSSKKDEKAGYTGNRWKVDVNIKLESDI